MNKYSPYKIAWNPDKLKSFVMEEITAPIYVRIKPTNRCNHNCWFCIYHYDYSYMHETCDQVSEISFEKLVKTILNLKDIGVKAITYSGGGEPLLYRNIKEIIGLTLQSRIACSVITNGQKLTGQVAEVLYEADWVRVSMDYFDEASFNKSREVKGVGRIFTNISDFAKNSQKCEIEINFVVTKDNICHLYPMAKRVKDLGVSNIRFSPIWGPEFIAYHKPIMGEAIMQIRNAKKDLEDDSFKVISSYNIEEKTEHREYDKCYFNQIVPVIGADLKVYTCHNKAYDPNGEIGNIREQSFSDLWFSKQTHNFFNDFDLGCCDHECANDKKNILINNIIDGHGDDFV